MKIEKIEVGIISVPLKKPFKTALRVVTASEDVVVKCTTKEGVIGFGSAAPTAAITGETHESLFHTITKVISPRLVNQHLENFSQLEFEIESAIEKNTSAKCAVHTAILDAYCKSLNISVLHMFGQYRNKVTTDVTISVNSPAEMAEDSLRAKAQGFEELKIKIGTQADLDIERVAAVGNAVGKHFPIRLDANQGWNPEEAVRTIRKIEDLGLSIEFIEQPVKAADIDGLRYVTQNVASEIAADESLFSAQDALTILSTSAADLLNIKLLKAGSIRKAYQIADIAEAFGVRCLLSCMLESKIGITSAAVLAAAHKNIHFVDLDAALLQAEDPIEGGVTFNRNEIVLPKGPGFGISNVRGWKERI